MFEVPGVLLNSKSERSILLSIDRFYSFSADMYLMLRKSDPWDKILWVKVESFQHLRDQKPYPKVKCSPCKNLITNKSIDLSPQKS